MSEQLRLSFLPKIILSSLRLIPRGLRKCLFSVLFMGYYYIAPRRRRIAQDNLQAVFSGKRPR